jgi:iron complex outermembrane receptor protein
MNNAPAGARRRHLALLVAGIFTAVPPAHAQGPLADAVDAAPLQTVVVTAERNSDSKKKRANGALGSRSDLETPFSTASVGSEQIEDRQIASLARVFTDDASVSSKGGTYTQSAYAINVRGLTLDFTNGYKIDGQPFQMYGVELPLESIETVQLLKGATGFLYGFAAPGGIINYITKKPTDERTFSVDAGYTSSSLLRGHIDAGGRFGDGDRFGYRLNLSHEHGDTYNGAKLNRDAGSLALDARLTNDITWSASVLAQERDVKGGVPTASLQVYPVASGLPSPVNGRANLGAYASSYYDSTMWMATTALDWRIGSHWKANITLGHSWKRIDSAYETLYLTSQSGNYSNRLNPFYRPTLTYNALQAVLEGSFDTGTLKHQVVLGAGRQALSRTLNLTSALSLFSPRTVGNLYQPAPVLVDTNPTNRTTFYTISTYGQKSLFASDTVAFGDHWSVLAGARTTEYENLNYAASGARSSTYNQRPTTPTAALLYRPTSDITFYTSYVEALEDGGTVSTTYANANEVLAPLTSRQAELGAKIDEAGWGGSAALFRVKRGAAYADYSANPQGIYIQGGELVYKGFEINGHAKLQPWLTVNAGATWLDAKYRATIPAIVGNRVESTPRFQAVLGLEARVPQVAGLSFHTDASYVGAQAANSAGNWTVPAVTLANAGAAYRTQFDNHPVTLRVEVSNLADRAYWYSSGSNALQIGAPRTVSLNARFDL